MTTYVGKNELEEDYAFTLRYKGVKVTPIRLRLMSLLSPRQKPLSFQDILPQLTPHNRGTIYRSLEALVEADIVKKIMFDPAKTLYEINIGHTHHHHIVCKSCGYVEDVNFMNKKRCAFMPSRKMPSSFASITDHSLEFFGICKTCFGK